MIEDTVEQQEHGYRSGHQLLSASLKLPRDDQDAVDRLSDMAGSLRPGETFSSYLTAYPLPSRSHYVVARTWQDLSAPRAGCVLTRSLLVRMAMWEAIEQPERLLPLLIPVEPGGKAGTVVLPLKSQPLPIVQDPRTVELVEAMFLESRQPIVVFEAPEAEVMTVRILTALWPGLRRNFAACGFALAPRKINGHDFDLLFAPKSARTRFADWPGRRIDVTGLKEPRHHWSAATASQIFQSDQPSLAANDILGVLKRDALGDESALRLVLLWNELAVKAETMPTAVLGMLDILNSQRESAPEALQRLAPEIARAADMASVALPTPEAWRFLTTLVGKFPFRPPPRTILRRIRQSATGLANRDPQAAFEFLEAEAQAARMVSVVLLVGLGDGLGSGGVLRASPDNLARLSPDMGLSLIALSSCFARSAVAAARREPSQWMSSLTRLLEAPDRELQRKARRRLTPLLDDDALAALLPPVLRGVNAKELADIAVRIGHQTKFEASAFDEPLGSAARDAPSLEALRNAVAANFSSPGADRFLSSTLSLDAADIAWLCGGTLESDRARHLLVPLLKNASDRSVQAVQRDSATRERMLELLLGDLTLCASQIARILSLGELPIEALLDIGHRLLPLLMPEDGGRLSEHLLERALAEAAPEDKRVAKLVAQAGWQIDPRQIARMAASTTASTLRVGSNIVALERAPANVRNGIVAHIDNLSDRLVHRGRENLGEAAYVAWAAMIASAGASDRDAQLRAAIPTLAFALRLTNLPVSSLIVVTFPVVYAQLLKSKGEEDFKLIPALFALPMSFFLDWDRAKAARRNLVEAFLNSTWPPVDLLLAAMDARIDQKILRRVSRNHDGSRYIVAIENSASRLSEPLHLRVQERLRTFRLSKRTDDWD
jgi:hypothetical protein